MSDLKNVLDREAHRVSPGPESWERVVRRTARRRTARRGGIAAVAVMLAAGGSLLAFRALGPAPELRPAGPQAILTAEIAGISIDYPADWTLLDVRTEPVEARTPGQPVLTPVLEILNITAQSCAQAEGWADVLRPDTVLLQVREASGGTPAGVWPRWPVALEATPPEPEAGGRTIPCGPPDASIDLLAADWTAQGRYFSAIALAGPDASEADVVAALAAFGSLRFTEGGEPFVELSAGPRQIVGSGQGWVASALEAADGEFCIHVEGEQMRSDTVGGACEFVISPRSPIDFSVKGMDDGRVAFGAVTPEASRVVINDVEARLVRPLDRYGVGYKLFAALVPRSPAVEVEVFDGMGRNIVSAGRTFPSHGASPAPPEATPEPLTPEARAARTLVTRFATARIARADPETLRPFVSEAVLTAYVEGRSGLSLFEEPGLGPYSGFEVTHSEVDDGAQIVQLGMSVEGDDGCIETFYEELVVRVAGEELIIVAASRSGVASEECPAPSAP
jgi:hypothetical protein